MFFEEGYSKTDIALALGASRQNVCRWCDLYEEGGVMCQKSITLCNPLEVGDLNIEKVDFST
jgi:hypothetical protein